jgi:hypothetical protein
MNLAVIGHPNLAGGSLANRIIVDHLAAEPEMEIRNLAELYPTFAIDELMAPLKQTVKLCGMILRDMITTHDMIYIPDVYNAKEDVQKRARDHAARLIAAVSRVRNWGFIGPFS